MLLNVICAGLSSIDGEPKAWQATELRHITRRLYNGQPMTLILPRSTPESEGIPSSAIVDFLQASEKMHDLHSFMLLRHGRVVAEAWWDPYRRDTPHMLYSLSKSFTSTAVGLAVADGLLTVDDTVISHFPDDTPDKVSPNLASMKVRHLLSMSTGHDTDATNATMSGQTSPYRAFLSLPVEHEPGTHFVYNSAASFILSAIVQKLTGKTLFEYLTPRLLDPLGIDGAFWESHPNGVNYGGWGLFLKTEDIARFGQLYLMNGEWEGKQLVPRAWVDDATTKQIHNGTDPESDWNQGYGYQFWRCRHNCFRGDGAFGQYCIVMPDQDAVIAITAGVADMQAVLNGVWDILLPALGSTVLPANQVLTGQLSDQLRSRAIPILSGKPASEIEESITGKTFTMEAPAYPQGDAPLAPDSNDEPLESVSFDFHNDRFIYRLGGKGEKKGIHMLRFGRESWVNDSAIIGGPQKISVASSGTWTGDNVFTLTVCQVQSPHIITFVFTFDNDMITMAMTVNVSFGPAEIFKKVGKVQTE